MWDWDAPFFLSLFSSCRLVNRPLQILATMYYAVVGPKAAGPCEYTWKQSTKGNLSTDNADCLRHFGIVEESRYYRNIYEYIQRYIYIYISISISLYMNEYIQRYIYSIAHAHRVNQNTWEKNPLVSVLNVISPIIRMKALLG